MKKFIRVLVFALLICSLASCTLFVSKESFLTVYVKTCNLTTLPSDSYFNLAVYKEDSTLLVERNNKPVTESIYCFDVRDILKVGQSYYVCFEIFSGDERIFNYKSKLYTYSSTNVKFDVIPKIEA